MDLGFGIETLPFFSLFTYFDRKNPLFTNTRHFGMPKKSRTPPNTAMLDVDWLSGKRADPRLRIPKSKKKHSMLGTTLSVTALFVFAASAVGLWSPLSQRWLRENGSKLLNLGNSPADETLAMLVSLDALNQTTTSPGPVNNSQPALIGSSQPSTSIVAAYHTTAQLYDDSIPPPPPMSSGNAMAPVAGRSTSARASLSDQPDSQLASVGDNTRIAARSAEFKRSQSKLPVVVPVEQPSAVVTANAEQSSNDDLQQLPIERLFPLLGSTQERRVRMVCDELSQRGVPNSLLDLAVQMARGDEALQLELLDRLTQVSEISPAPILCWMAQSSSKAVRKRAIAILGSFQDREVMQQLRFLASREPDSSLRQLIEQTVASNFGTVR
ncbi:MAG: hypothetical protein MUC43_06645 [Pirellula sp.]|jgi:hypothetical protein|nr:hypothetical protein [Pirellula sp.]